MKSILGVSDASPSARGKFDLCMIVLWITLEDALSKSVILRSRCIEN